MTGHHEVLARQAVEQFRQSLGEEARAQITDAQLLEIAVSLNQNEYGRYLENLVKERPFT